MNNSIIETIKTIGAIAGALTATGGLIISVWKVYKKMKSKLDQIITAIDAQGKQIDTLVKHDRTQYLSILRLTVMTDSIPLSERISAGREYIEAGGNGDVKTYVETHLLPFDKIVREGEIKQ